MKHKDSAAKMAAFPVSRGSYQQPSATRQKKAEAKKRKSPCTPFREKGKGKETQTGFPKETVFRAGGRASGREGALTGARHGGHAGTGARHGTLTGAWHGGHAGRVTLPAALDADLDTAARMFQGSAEDRRIWASIAWRVGVEAFHFALMDKLAEDAVDGQARRPAAAFQAFLNARFPKAEGGAA